MIEFDYKTITGPISAKVATPFDYNWIENRRLIGLFDHGSHAGTRCLHDECASTLELDRRLNRAGREQNPGHRHEHSVDGRVCRWFIE